MASLKKRYLLLNMDYKGIYYRIIEKAKKLQTFRIYDKKHNKTYYEGHHIIPVCMGGTGYSGQWLHENVNNNNVVGLTPKEHFLCHKLLCEIYPDNKKIKYAFWRMLNISNTKRDNMYVISSREYSEMRSFVRRVSGEYKHSNETLVKMSEAKAGKTYEEIYGVEKAAAMRLRRSKENKNKKYDRTHSLETRALISKKTMGRNKGKTYEEIYGVEKAAILRRKRTESNLKRANKNKI